MVGNIGASDGNKFTVKIGQFPLAQAFKKAVADKDTPRAAAMLKNLVLMETMSAFAKNKPISSINGTPIIQMMNDPDWSPKQIASLFAEVSKNGDVKVSGNALFALGELNPSRAESVMKELKAIDPELANKIQQHITGTAGLEKAIEEAAEFNKVLKTGDTTEIIKAMAKK